MRPVDLVSIVCVFYALAVGAQTVDDSKLPPSLRRNKPQTLLCIPEHMWTCNGVGDCFPDLSPDTLVAWKIDVAHTRYAMCRRDGSSCAPWRAFSAKIDTAFLVLHESAWHPETFKIDRDAGRFVEVRLSGAATDVDATTNPATINPNVANFQVITRTGTCVAVSN